MKLFQRVAVLAIILFAFNATDAADSQEDLLKRVERLEKELQLLKKELEQVQKPAAVQSPNIQPATAEAVVKESTTPDKSQKPAVVFADQAGFGIRSPDTNFLLRLRGTVQGDARFYPERADGAAKETFLLRRVRPALEGTVFEKFDYRLMFDFGSGLTSSPGNVDFVQEAYVNARLLPEFQIQAGKFKEPVGLERLKSDTDMVFVERNYPTQLVPNRDVGLQFQGDLLGGALSYQAGIFNGVADSGSDDIETADGDKDLAARLFLRPFLLSGFEPLQGWGFGLAGTVGRQKGTLRSFVTPGQQKFFSYRTAAGTNAATANITADGEHWRLVPQLSYYWGPFGILGEYAISEQKLHRAAGGEAAFAQIRNTSWEVTGSYFLTGEKNSFGSINPRRPVSFHGGGGWGAWEVAAQVGQLRIDPDAFPLFANPDSSAREALSWGLGLNWYPNRNLKWMLDFERTDFKGGEKSPLNGKGENAILTRVQLAF